MNIFYAGGVNGGGSGPFLQEASFLEDLGPEDAPFVVQQRHRIDLDDDGAADVTFSANFVVYGLDEDTNAIPDKWESLIETHRAWPF
ncbi:MAG TPA: hypothetical protein DDZ68_01620 [Parvularcula sp.]|nr:hypothetical protein [Parvularcula sp.]HBS35988.1 hypothetical protein [Parvularcula sp.]